MFGLHKFILHRNLVDRTAKFVLFRQVLGLLRVPFRQAGCMRYFIGHTNLIINNAVDTERIYQHYIHPPDVLVGLSTQQKYQCDH